MDLPRAAGVPLVLVYPARETEPEHEKQILMRLGERLAALLRGEFGGLYQQQDYGSRPRYLIPTDTLIGLQQANHLGVYSDADLFGGVAPFSFMPTKAITHALHGPQAWAPPGWSRDFSAAVHDSVLPGYTVFNIDDARLAGARLLQHGSARIKPVHATAGRGQQRVSTVAELESALRDMDTTRLADCGLVIEENLVDVITYSVGQVRVAGMVASYVGTQRLTQDNQGEWVYGGSDLVVVRGGYDALMTLNLEDPFKVAVAKARIYDAAADRCFPDFFASRRNYDVASGRNDSGQFRCGVLEQSWRTGGASSAEVAALEAFAADPALQVVKAATIELFGTDAPAPAGAIQTYNGSDPQIGQLRKYVKVETYGHH
ncbi:DUF3182 family protein [Alcaligenaceae bacterium]|nr:DUF3182 family protein [Alcaligenaceae bacterium]